MRACIDCNINISHRGNNTKRCGACAKEYRRGYMKEYLKGYRGEKRERIRKKNKEYREQHKIKIQEYLKEYYKENKEYWKDSWKKWVEKNPERREQYLKEWRKNNRDKLRATKHRRRAHELSAPGEFSAEDEALLRKRYDRCVYCGSKGKLTVDHVVPLSKGGRNDVYNLVLACNSCNASKCDKPIEEWFKKYPKKEKTFQKITGRVLVYDEHLGMMVIIPK